MKLDSFCKSKTTNQQPTGWEKLFSNPMSNRDLIPKKKKECKKITIEKQNNPIKHWGIELNRELKTKECEMDDKHLKTP